MMVKTILELHTDLEYHRIELQVCVCARRKILDGYLRLYFGQ